jgi:uncharacterized SAM-binding protein YcdF (DUF218 family)
VTDAFHLPRALYVFHRLGLEVSGEGVARPSHISRLDWLRSQFDERVRLAWSAVLFLRGAHKPLVTRVWGG